MYRMLQQKLKQNGNTNQNWKDTRSVPTLLARGRLYEGRIAIFSTFLNLPVDRFNLRLRFGIYKLKFLKSIVESRSVVSQLFG